MRENERLEQFAKCLKSLRIERGFTQFELAERMGTTESAVSRMDSGKYNPSLLLLIKTADALEMEASDLIKGLK